VTKIDVASRSAALSNVWVENIGLSERGNPLIAMRSSPAVPHPAAFAEGAARPPQPASVAATAAGMRRDLALRARSRSAFAALSA
jgi:hypothetical protein